MQNDVDYWLNIANQGVKYCRQIIRRYGCHPIIVFGHDYHAYGPHNIVGMSNPKPANDNSH